MKGPNVMRIKNYLVSCVFVALLGLGVVSCNRSQNNESGNNTEEKVLNVYMPSPDTLQPKLAEGFEKQTGIHVNVTSGTTGDLMARIESEKNNSLCDVLITASWSEGLSNKDKPLINAVAYTPKNADKVYDGFKEADNKMWGTSASAVGVIYNVQKVKEANIDIEKLDWADFGDSSKWNLPFEIPDPTKSGASKDFIAGFITRDGKDTDNQKIVDSWVNNGLKNGGKNKAALTACQKGTYAAILAGVDYNLYVGLKTDGEDYGMKMYYPKSGTVVNPRPAMILGSAKHINNAKLFMDYLLSDEAQKFVADEMLLPGRKDIKADSSRPQFADIQQFTGLDWSKMADQGSTLSQNLVDAISNKK